MSSSKKSPETVESQHFKKRQTSLSTSTQSNTPAVSKTKKTPQGSKFNSHKNNVIRDESNFKIISSKRSGNPSYNKGGDPQYSMVKFDADVKWESDQNKDDDDIKVLEVIIQPSNYRHMTIKPLVQVGVGAGFVAASVAVFPWIQYVVLQETLENNDIYESHVSTGLFTECRVDVHDVETCKRLQLTPQNPFYHTLVGLGIGVTLALVAVLAAMGQAASSYYGETSEDPNTYKPIPSLMPLEFLASVSAWLSAIILTITIMVTKMWVGGSAALGIFMCGVGVAFLMSAGWEAWGVAMAPARAGTPWVISEKKDFDSDSENDVTPDHNSDSLSDDTITIFDAPLDAPSTPKKARFK